MQHLITSGAAVVPEQCASVTTKAQQLDSKAPLLAGTLVTSADPRQSSSPRGQAKRITRMGRAKAQAEGRTAHVFTFGKGGRWGVCEKAREWCPWSTDGRMLHHVELYLDRVIGTSHLVRVRYTLALAMWK